MARIRTIKPDFFTSADIVALSPLARLLYIGLWCEADREGRMGWNTVTFKLRYLPADACDIDALCEELTRKGLVKLYGDGLAYIPKFTEHQHVNPRESVSTLPEPEQKPRVATRPSRVSDTQGGKGRKGKEGDIDASKTRKHPLPENFGISDRVKSWASEKGHDRLELRLESFKAKASANAYQYADWDAAFMESIRENWAKLPTAATVTDSPGGGRRAL